jgi:hypothetical protein
MRKYLPYIFLVICLFLEIGIFGRFYLEYNISLVLALCILEATKKDIKESIVFALVAGLLVDITLLSRGIFMTIFLLISVTSVFLVKKKYLSFLDLFSVIISIAFFILLRLVALQVFNGMGLELHYLLRAFVANLIFSILLVLIYLKTNKILIHYEEKFRKN